MEVVGALASALQLVSQCGQVTMTIIKWYQSVKTVDQRVTSFVQEVNTLKLTYESLTKSLESPSMLEAARDTNRDVGGHLWAQLSLTLQDCERTMNAIINVLRKIQASSNLLRPVVKQLRESLHSGDLFRLREQVVMFNSTLQLPMQMISLSLQLRQQEVTTAQQVRVNEDLSSLRQSIDALFHKLTIPSRQDSWDASTLHETTSTEKKWRDNMESYVGSAKKFLATASAAATTLSTAAASRFGDNQPAEVDQGIVRRGSAWAPLTRQQISGISTFVDNLPDDTGSGTPVASDVLSNSDLPPDTHEISDDDDIELQILQRLLQNGQTRLDEENYAVAEDNFREAVELSQENEFGSKVACTTADIILLLAECLIKQDKFDDAISFLKPIAISSTVQTGSPQVGDLSFSSPASDIPDKGQAFTANHLLGEVYLKKGDGDSAEQHALQAFKGRKKLLGDRHSKTIESIHLVIGTYKAKGKDAKAEAYRVFLEPASNTNKHVRSLSKVDSPTPRHINLAPTAANDIPTRQRRPTFNFSGFRRSEKHDNNITSAPMAITAPSSSRQPFLKLDEPIVLSTSPHNTSSLYSSSNGMSNELPPRQHSLDSTSFRPELHRWKSDSDASEINFSHQRTQSVLSRAPTLFATMSRSEMEQMFREISILSEHGKTSKAVDKGAQILQNYDPTSAIFVHRAAEMKENIKKSKGLGLAGTGYGFSPLHFFCSLNYEALVEIEILLQLGADVQAVGYKAGYGKLDPFTPLNLAVDRKHENVVRMLLSRGATWQSTLMKKGSRYKADRDPVHPLLQGCQKGYAKIVELLLESRMELNEDDFPRTSWHGNSLLHEASFRCDVSLVEFLMQYARHTGLLNENTYTFVGLPGQQDAFGMTPIMYAADMRDSNDMKLMAHKKRHRVECLRLLLEHDCSQPEVRETDSDEVFVDHPRQGSAFKRLGTDLHLEDKKGNTVFWYADESRGGDEELRNYLNEQSRKSHLIEI